MMTRVVRPLSAGALSLVLGLVACQGEHLSVDAPVGEPSYDMRLIAVAAPRVPRSAALDATALTLTSFDTSVADAYSRSGDLSFRLRVNNLNTANIVSGQASLPTTAGWNLTGTTRRLSVDGRFPVLAGAASSRFLAMEGPEVVGSGMWRFRLNLRDATGSTNYTVALVRYGLKVADSLDQVAVLNTGSNFTVRDTLSVLGGSTSPAIAGGCTPGTAAVVTATSNPLILGTFTTTAGGLASNVVKCLSDPTGLYYRETRLDFTQTPLAPNSGVTFSLPKYNYLIVYNTATGAQVLRAQLGQDIRSTGAPVNNGFAPMPCRVTPINTAGTEFTLCNFSGVTDVRTTRAKISAPGGQASVDSVTVSFTGLKALGGTSVYKVWLINPATGAPPVPTTGFVRVLQVDTITDVPVLDTDTLRTLTDSTVATSTFLGYPMPLAAHTSIRLRITAASAGLNLADYTHVMVSIESNAAAAAPSARRPLVARYEDQRGTPTNYRDDEYFDAPAPVFGITDAAFAFSAFAPGGRGLGGFRGDELSVGLNDLARPPTGYYYQGWLVDVNGGPSGKDTIYVPVDTLRAPFPGRALLVDADSALVDPVVQDAPRIISAGDVRNFAASLGLDPARLCDTNNPAKGACPFGAFESFIVTVEPKGSNPASPSPSVLFVGSIPGVVKTGK